MRKGVFIFLLIAFHINVFSQNNISFTASVDKENIIQDDYFNVTFTLNNAKGSKFNPPSFDGFEVISGPSTSQQISIVNGHRSMSQGYSYQLIANKIGKYTIGSASIIAKGKTLKTNPLIVTVSKTKQLNKRGYSGRDAFLEVEISDSTAYVGQQIVLNYNIYYRVNINGNKIIAEDNYEDFYVEAQNINNNSEKVIVNGETYYKNNYKRVSLFPRKPGGYEIDPMRVRLDIVVGENRQRGFFAIQNTKPIVVKSKAINILIEPVPKGSDAKVGEFFSLNSTINHKKIRSGKALFLNMTIEGDCEMNSLEPNDIICPSDFDIYEPKELSSESFIRNGKIISKKIYQYTIIPAGKGKKEIIPTLSYFDVNKNETIIIAPDTIQLNVLNNANISNSSETANFNDLKPYIPTKNLDKNKFYFDHPLFKILFIIPFLFWGGTVSKQRLKNSAFYKKSFEKEPSLVDKLKLARQESGDNVFMLYSKMENLLTSYLGNKLNIPSDQINKQTIYSRLIENKIPNDIADNILDLLNTSEKALYSGYGTVEKSNEVCDNARTIFDWLEKRFG